MSAENDTALPDSVRGHWVDRSPRMVRPYLRLSRLDRPIGTWLLVWPGWWAITLASALTASAPDTRPWFGLPDLFLLGLFGIGALAMRGAGCTYNDIVDRKIDAQVDRTRDRPIPSGAVGVPAAVVWLILQALIGLAVLLTFNSFAIWLGVASLALIAAYPFMKRITWWPQLWLGLAFNYGALLGWAAVTDLRPPRHRRRRPRRRQIERPVARCQNPSVPICHLRRDGHPHRRRRRHCRPALGVLPPARARRRPPRLASPCPQHRLPRRLPRQIP